MGREKGRCGLDDLQLLLLCEFSCPHYTFSASAFALPGKSALNYAQSWYLLVQTLPVVLGHQAE